MQLICFSELLKTTNIQKPPVYKHVLPRVLETTTNNEYSNKHDKNIAKKLSPTPSTHLPYVYELPSDTSKERQSRVDRILEKYRRQPSSSISRQFSRSFSCNAATESALSTESNLPLTAAKSVTSDEDSKQSSSGPRSVSPYALFDRSDRTCTTRRENKTNPITDSLLLKSYSLKSLGEYRTRAPSVDFGSISKSNNTFVNNNDDDPPSWSSSSSTATTTTTKSMAPKEDANHNYYSPALMDWTVGNCSEETVSDRIKRRSYYVKLK